MNKTGKKIQLNSGYRSPEEQAELYAKLGPPKAAPPGRSRHESGLAIDMNSPDANKAAELGLMQKYGFTRPVRGETWHVEPVETAKRGGSPDNPYKPGAPVAVANKGGDVVSPGTGKIPQSLGPGMSAGAAESSAGSAAVASAEGMKSDAIAGAEQMGADAVSGAQDMVASAVGDAQSLVGDMPISASSVEAPDNSSIDPATGLRVRPVSPEGLRTQVSTSGEGLRTQSVEMEDSQWKMRASSPPIVNNIQAGGSGPPPVIPKSPAPKATTRPQDSSFMRALARDFSHPTAFTTVSMT